MAKRERTQAQIDADARRTGRPPMKNPRSCRIAAAMTPKEKRRLERIAKRASMPPSHFVRAAVLYALDMAESENGIDFGEGEE